MLMKLYNVLLLMAISFVSANTLAQEKLYLREVSSSDDKETKLYTYNKFGKIDTLFHVDDGMKLDRYLIYKYDEDGKCIECTYLPFNYETFQYDTPSHIVKYEYEGDNMVKRIVHKGGDIVSGMTTYHYNSNNLVDSVSQIVPATVGSDVMKMQSYIKYYYDTNGRITSDETYNNNNFFNDEVVMEKNSRSDYTYDVSGNLISVVGQYYDTDLQSFFNGFKHDYLYDGNGNKGKYTYYLYNRSGATWTTEHYIVYTYNTRNKIDKCVLPEEIELTWPDFMGAKHQPNTESWFYFDEYAQEYALAVTYTFHFDEKGSSSILSVSNDNESVACYVSQTGNELCLAGNTGKVRLSIYDTNGNLMLKSIVDGNVDISGLENGIYLVNINGRVSKITK